MHTITTEGDTHIYACERDGRFLLTPISITSTGLSRSRREFLWSTALGRRPKKCMTLSDVIYGSVPVDLIKTT
jgi:hypothetical protein